MFALRTVNDEVVIGTKYLVRAGPRQIDTSESLSMSSSVICCIIMHFLGDRENPELLTKNLTQEL